MNSRDLYHPNCHCKELAINVPRINDITLIAPVDKIAYFFNAKNDLFHSLGYKNSEKDKFMKIMKNLAIEAYRYGNYIKEKHTNFGYQINLKITIPGANEKKNSEYDVVTCYTIFPNGKLKLNTLVGGWK